MTASSVRSIDAVSLSGSSFFADPYPVYGQLLANPQPVRDAASGAWLISRYADVESLLRDSRTSKQFQRETPTPFETSVLFRDLPDHARVRAVLNQAFSSGIFTGLDAKIAQLADEAIDRMQAAQDPDFIRDFALPLPVSVIAELLGIPPVDRHRIHEWSSAFIPEEGIAPDGSAMRQYTSIRAMEEYFRALLASGTPGGLLAELTKPTLAGDHLTGDEIVGNAILLLVAGHETTVNLLGNGIFLLLDQPSRFCQLRDDPKLLTTAIEEMLRFESPVQLGTFRVATETLEIGGVSIEPGSRVTAVLGAANRDPAVFPEPDRFQLDRGSNRHLAFGIGPHRCIGAMLARSEARIGLTRIFDRLPNLRLDNLPAPGNWLQSAMQRIGIGEPATPLPPTWRQNPVTRGLKELKVAL